MNISRVEPPLVEVGDFFEEEEQTVMEAVREREIWLHNNNNNVINNNNTGHHHQDHHHYDEDDDLLVGVMDDAASLFYADDDFPCLPDFSSCMSSSSSSSSPPAAATVKTTIISVASSSNTSSDSADTTLLPSPLPTLSSAASMEISQQHTDRQGGGGEDCVYMMETFGNFELMESDEFFDPSSIFENEENLWDESTQLDPVNNPPEEEGHACGGMMVLQDERQQEKQPPMPPPTDEEMSSVFLEWLKMNKDSVSASDLRSVRLKKATIECAAKRLGGGKEGMKQLLKLILEWVQTSHLQKKRRMDYHVTNNNNNENNDNLFFTDQFHQDTTNPTSDLNHQPSFGTEWISPPPPPPPPYGVDLAAAALAPPPFSQPVVGYGNNNNLADPFSSDFQALHSTHSQFIVYNNNTFGTAMAAAAAYGGYGNNQYPYQHFQGVVVPDRLGPLATKEARKKRMARQRRNATHHHHNHQRHHNVQEQQQNQQNQPSDYCSGAATVAPLHANPPNWLYWPPPPVVVSNGGGAASVVLLAQSEPPPSTMMGRDARGRSTAMQSEQNHQQSRVSSDKRQGWKSEKNLKFLLQKVLKQSDVGNLGRIVLPKKEAEAHLPELEERDGISIAMEDIGTSRVWNMRYRYWPNNKSRMYLLENTGDFVRTNGLQEGDFIVIYSDVKCGKYMIRGVKVRQVAGAKLEAKKAAKSSPSHKVNGNGSDDPSSANKNEKKQQPWRTEIDVITRKRSVQGQVLML